jgi:hypothetical protein
MLSSSHSSDQTRSLDLRIFAVQKAESSRVHHHELLNSQTEQVVKMLAGFQKATLPTNIIHAFGRAGIVTH